MNVKTNKKVIAMILSALMALSSVAMLPLMSFAVSDLEGNNGTGMSWVAVDSDANNFYELTITITADANWTVPGFDKDIGNTQAWINSTLTKDNIEKITLVGPAHIGRGAFDSHTALKEVNLGTALQTIGRSAFENCENLATLSGTLNTITKVDDNAFKKCKKMVSVPYFPALQEIGAYAFGMTTSNIAGTARFPGTLKTYDALALAQTYVSEIIFEDGCTANLTENAFNTMKMLQTVQLAKDMTFNDYATKALYTATDDKWLENNYHVAFIAPAGSTIATQIEQNVKTMYTSHDSDYTKLSIANGSQDAVTRPAPMYYIKPTGEKISDFAIWKDSAKESVKKLPGIIWYLEELAEAEGAKQYKLVVGNFSGTSGKLNSELGTFWISGGSYRPWDSYTASITEVILEDGFTSVGAMMFQNHSALTKATLPNTVKRIDEYAFAKSSSANLTLVDGLPDSIETIGLSAFNNNMLQVGDTLIIPASIKSIGDMAFNSGQGSYSKIKFEQTENAVTIGEAAWQYDANVKTVFLPKNCTIGKDAFAIGNWQTAETVFVFEGNAPTNWASLDQSPITLRSSVAAYIQPNATGFADITTKMNTWGFTTAEVVSTPIGIKTEDTANKKVTMDIINPTANDKKYVVIYAAYNEDGILEDVSYSDGEILAFDRIKNTDTEVTLTRGGNTYKAFLWDGFVKITPYIVK